MARDSGGTYSTPAGQPVVTGTTIDAPTFNTLVADLGSEITDSLSRSGKGNPSAAFKQINGTVGAPSYAFANDTGLGIYRSASGEASLVAGGVQIAKWSSSGFTVIAGVVDNFTYISADVTESAGSLVTFFSIPMAANEVWQFTGHVIALQVGGGVVDYRPNPVSSPVTATFRLDGSDGSVISDGSAGWDLTSVATSTDPLIDVISGIIVNGVNAGTFTLQFGKAGGTSVTIKKGTWFRYRRLV
jgi:hypothetical protein